MSLEGTVIKRGHEFWGELIGTFILVFFGCGAVAVTVLFSSHIGLFQIAGIWGLGVTLAIYAVRHLSCAHINPAVTLAMVVSGRMLAKKIPTYLTAQFLGALVAAIVLYLLFSGSIVNFELINNIVRGEPASIKTAMIFGEYYPNPGAGAAASVTALNAFFAETVGTFVLVFMIFALTDGCNVGRPNDSVAPLFIGATVAGIICIIAPLTMAALNPARDLAPRLFAYFAGWGPAAMPDQSFGFLTIYVLGPITGGILAAFFFDRLVKPLMLKKGPQNCC
jgi:glycerol uptake facilitator